MDDDGAGKLLQAHSWSDGDGDGNQTGALFSLKYHQQYSRADLLQLMLVAMTYNTYLFLSIVVGAFIGHVLYEGEMDVG